jgi:hypothetical protein
MNFSTSVKQLQLLTSVNSNVKQSFQETWSLFKNRRETFWASTVMVGSSTQFIYFNKSTSVFIMSNILAMKLDSVVLFVSKDRNSIHRTCWKEWPPLVMHALIFSAWFVSKDCNHIYSKCWWNNYLWWCMCLSFLHVWCYTVNTLRTGHATLRFYGRAVADRERKSAILRDVTFDSTVQWCGVT